MANALTLSTFRLVFSAERRAVLPPLQRGDLIRGFFGISLRKLVCHDLSLDCRGCILRASCPYPPLFEPRALVAESGWKDPPPPFVFRPALSPLAIESGGTFHVEMSLIGRAIERLPYILVAMRGSPLAPGLASGKLRLTHLFQLLPDDAKEIWNSRASNIGTLDPAEPWTPTDPAAEAPRRVRVDFETPAEIVEGGRAVRKPELRQIIRRLADRADALAWAHCGGPLEVDRKALAERCTARLAASDLRWTNASRRSSRTSQEQHLSGVTGWAEYEGDLKECWPLLKLGEKIHVGKDAAFGKGRLRISALE